MPTYTTQDLVIMLSDAANTVNEIKGVEATRITVEQNGPDLFLVVKGERWSTNSSMKLPKFLTLDDANLFATQLQTAVSAVVQSAISAKISTLKQTLQDIGNSL